jgi:hypothetical protein
MLNKAMQTSTRAVFCILLLAATACDDPSPDQAVEMPAAPLKSAPKGPAQSGTFVEKDFVRTLDSLHDVTSTKVVVARSASKITSTSLEFPGTPKLLAVKPRGTGVELFGTGVSGKVEALAFLEPIGTDAYWKWTRIVGTDFQPALAEFDGLIKDMTVVANTSTGAIRFTMEKQHSGSNSESISVAKSQETTGAALDSALHTTVQNLTFAESDFVRTVDSLKDIKETKSIVIRVPAPIKSASIEFTGKPKFLTLKPKGTGVELVGTGTSGQTKTLALLEPTGEVAYWKWARILGKDFKPALSEFDALMKDMTVVANAATGEFRFTMSKTGSALSSSASASTAKSTPESIPGIAAAIDAAKKALEDEATAYSKKNSADFDTKRKQKIAAKNAAREGRNDQQRDHELHGYIDDSGHWHAPDGHSSNNRDRGARGEMYRGSSNGSAGPDWGSIMRNEVIAEKRANPNAGKRETTLLETDDPIDCAEITRFIADKRGKITDARIKGLLQTIRRNLPVSKPLPNGEVPPKTATPQRDETPPKLETFPKREKPISVPPAPA